MGVKLPARCVRQSADDLNQGVGEIQRLLFYIHKGAFLFVFIPILDLLTFPSSP